MANPMLRIKLIEIQEHHQNIVFRGNCQTCLDLNKCVRTECTNNLSFPVIRVTLG